MDLVIIVVLAVIAICTSIAALGFLTAWFVDCLLKARRQPDGSDDGSGG
ncbi:hypothetical protein [Azorhizobium doebereinerae]|nr:hypothetical protein [Azorhizobium doebereinerae]